MKISIDNLKAQMQGKNLNIYQKADALIEFNKLIDYVEELEKTHNYKCDYCQDTKYDPYEHGDGIYPPCPRCSNQ